MNRRAGVTHAGGRGGEFFLWATVAEGGRRCASKEDYSDTNADRPPTNSGWLKWYTHTSTSTAGVCIARAFQMRACPERLSQRHDTGARHCLTALLCSQAEKPPTSCSDS